MSTAHAEHRALWEWGAGAGSLSAPFYRGAKQTKDYTIPIPFLRYRGKNFSSDEDGMRGRIFDDKRLKLDISFSGSVPVPKDIKGARINMPSLDPIGQVGPALKFFISASQSNKISNSLSLEFPVRTVFSIGDPLLEHQGWAISPNINWIHQIRRNDAIWRIGVRAGPLYADQKFHNYFYQVEPRYITTQRDAYNAQGGYSGSRITIRLSRNSKQLFFGFFVRYDDLNNATFIDSPLVETETYTIYGVAVVWILSASDARAQHRR